jgi:DNA-directed RNA polymerase specialized sigma24 family protein
MAHRIVFTLIMRLTANRETAEELTIDVFHDVWRRAWRYDSAIGTVLGWIMNQARSRAIDRLRSESRKKRRHGGNIYPLVACVSPAKNVVSIAWRSSVVSAANAARSASPRSR